MKIGEQGSFQLETLNILAPVRELKNRLSDNNTRVKERATEVLLNICLHGLAGKQIVL